MDNKIRLLKHVIYAIDFALETEAWLLDERTKLEKERTKLRKMIEEIEKQPD